MFVGRGRSVQSYGCYRRQAWRPATSYFNSSKSSFPPCAMAIKGLGRRTLAGPEIYPKIAGVLSIYIALDVAQPMSRCMKPLVDK